MLSNDVTTTSYLNRNCMNLIRAILALAINDADKDYLKSEDARAYMDLCGWYPSEKLVSEERYRERLYYESHTAGEISREKHVSYNTIKTYCELNGWEPKGARTVKHGPPFNVEECKEILRNNFATPRELSVKYGVSIGTIYTYVKMREVRRN